MSRSDLLAGATAALGGGLSRTPALDSEIGRAREKLLSSGAGKTFARYEQLTKRPWEFRSAAEEAFEEFLSFLRRTENSAYAEGYLAAMAPNAAPFSGGALLNAHPVKELLERLLEPLAETERLSVVARIDAFHNCSQEMRGRILAAVTPEERLQFTEFLTRRAAGLKDQKEQTEAELRRLDKDVRQLEFKASCFRDIIDWLLPLTYAEMQYEKPVGSQCNKLQIAAKNGRLFDHHAKDDKVPEETLRLLQSDLSVILVEHDWARAFKNAHDFTEGEWRIPFDNTCYEFCVSGKRVCAIVGSDDGKPSFLQLFIKAVGGAWIRLSLYRYSDGEFQPSLELDDSGDDKMKPLVDGLALQIRAISIALDAEIVTREIIRAPHTSNALRERKSYVAPVDYHIVKLARRFRPLPSEATGNGEKMGSKRLHFRRGHWRHYATFKTWIRWTLVGDPDLGFIEKHYAL